MPGYLHAHEGSRKSRAPHCTCIASRKRHGRGKQGRRSVSQFPICGAGVYRTLLKCRGGLKIVQANARAEGLRGRGRAGKVQVVVLEHLR